MFHGGITDRLKNKLEAQGVNVLGEIKVSAHGDDEQSDESECDESDKESSTAVTSLTETLSQSGGTLNLDITAMIAYVSALTNGCADYVFKEPILSQQAEWERLRPGKVEFSL